MSAHPEVVRYRTLWLQALHNRIDPLNRRARFVDALPIADQALREGEAMARDFPGEIAPMQFVASAHACRAEVLSGLQRKAEAVDSFTRAAQMYDSLLKRQPDQRTRRRAAETWHNLGTLVRASEPLRARLSLLRAVELLRALASDFPHVPKLRLDLHIASANCVDVLRAVDDQTAARSMLEEAVADRVRLLAVAPEDRQATQCLWRHFRVLFQVLERQGDHAALARCAEDLSQSPQLGEMSTKAWAGQELAVACSLAARDAALQPTAREELIAARAQRGLALMHHAYSLGWRPDLTKPMFDSVRQHAEFTRLLARVREAKASSPTSSGR